MALRLSRGCEYALQSLIYLATQPVHKPVLQRDISKSLNIPSHFLGKILQYLSRNGIVVSHKGKGGGFQLAKAARDISPYEVIVTIDGATFLDSCILGFPECGKQNPCPIHPQWQKIRDNIIRILKETNIEELSKNFNRKKIVIEGI